MKKYSTIMALAFLLLSKAVYAGPMSDPTPIRAISAVTFLNSLGVNTHVAQGYNPAHYVEPLKYLGVRNIRDSAKNLSGYFMLHGQTGVRVDLIAGDMNDLLVAARTLAKQDVLMALEGPNEPNNWPITYKEARGGGAGTWRPVAEFQRDLYKAVKSDATLANYPVFHVSEGGAETDNVCLQFLKVPANAGCALPEGTVLADYANVHNYVSGHRNRYVDNMAWNAADPTLNADWDGLYGEYGKTWRGKFSGYSVEELQKLPRVSTETGWDSVAGPGGEKTQAVVLVNTYLAQFKRGWLYTFIYELGDGEGGAGNQGLYRKDWTPKVAATYIHNLTTILSDFAVVKSPEALPYSISDQPETVHDLLLQKSNGKFYLIVWSEKVGGTQDVKVNLGAPRAVVRLYNVSKGTQPIATYKDQAMVPLILGEGPQVLEIR